MTTPLDTATVEAIIAGSTVELPLPAEPRDVQRLRAQIAAVATNNGWFRNCGITTRDGVMRFFVKDASKPRLSRERVSKQADVPAVEPAPEAPLEVDPALLRSVKDPELGWTVQAEGQVISRHENRESAQAEVRELRAAAKAQASA